MPEIDIARTFALASMIVFHFAYDLSMFGFLPPDAMIQPGPRLAAQLIAGSFLFLSGVSLCLAHCDGIRWRPYLRRLGVLVLAAAAVSLVTRLAMPHEWVRFGILHSIAASTVLALPFLKAPVPVMAIVVVATLAMGQVSFSAFDGPLWLWSGLSATLPFMMDYEPVFPWFGICLSGVLFTRLFREKLTSVLDESDRYVRMLSWPGKHSLAIYLLHQPILFGSVYLASRIFQS
ncbi:DUF1624 domain-containing protein [Aliiroseovarius sp. Z3]|uniref:heparan-alpha-glucosaminide N-acetyltransferase n=1 Tax=Aliiroseovarius sp. Z3 TaxID=2811402 RepID=UPI0023B20B2B|nr:heparan-alpha-glucosaminide N-acetyltransferase [Aliiroseovarius sp. Z3]MDE9450800.1 DUF1624 domain-containing protein [Aliiroseovarius sp. Z3]